MTSEIIRHVPTGEANAMTARAIWQAAGMWAESSVSQHLSKLTRQLLLNRKQVPIPSGGFQWVYWR